MFRHKVSSTDIIFTSRLFTEKKNCKNQCVLSLHGEIVLGFLGKRESNDKVSLEVTSPTSQEFNLIAILGAITHIIVSINLPNKKAPPLTRSAFLLIVYSQLLNSAAHPYGNLWVPFSHLALIPYKIHPTPIKMTTIREMEIFSARPINPTAVDKINIHGPKRANVLFRTKAFPTSFILIKIMATVISTNPEKIRNNDMPNMDLSMT